MATFLTSMRAAFTGMNPIPGSLNVGYRGFFHGCYNGPPTNSLYEENPEFNRGHTFSGIGTFHTAYEDKTYSGRWSKNILGPETGDSVKLLKNSDLYIGELQYGQPSGSGKLIFGQTRDGFGDRQSNASRYSFDVSNYDAYEGGFKEGLPHYFGKLTWKTGVTYSGQFNQGKKDGVFKAEFPDGLQLWLSFEKDQLKSVSFSSDLSNPITPVPTQVKYNERLLIEYPTHRETEETLPKKSLLGRVLGNRDIEKRDTATTTSKGIFLDNSGTGAFYYHGEISDRQPNGRGLLASFDLRLHGGYTTEEGSFTDGWIDGQGKRTLVTERFTIEGPNIGAGLLETISTGQFTKGNDKNTKKQERWIVPLLGLLERTKAATKASAPAQPQTTSPSATPDNPDNPESRARRVVAGAKKKYIVADGGLYVKGNLGGLFGAQAERHDLESASIIENARAGTVKVNTGSADILCDGLQGLTAELAGALRIERAKVYPNSPQARDDRKNFPDLRWEEPS